MDSFAEGFKQNGFVVDYFDELKETDFKINSKYDYIIGYDFSPIKLKIDNNINIPCIAYFADVIESKASGVGEDFSKYVPYLNNDDIYVFYWDRRLTEQSKIKNIHYLPMFVNTEVYKPLGLMKEYDIMFAGRLDTDLRLETTIELMMSFPNLNFAWFAIEKHYNDALSRTNKKELIKKAYKGFIDNETDMAKEINKSKIVYTINSQGLSSLNHRTIQTAACKSLVITDYREEINLFRGDLPFYVDTADLIEKIKYYMDNERAYRYTVNKCYEAVSQHLSSKICVNIMLETICKL